MMECEESALDGWTKDEKFNLFQAIKFSGSHNIDVIHSNIPTKNVEQIKLAIDYYKHKALRHPIITERKGKNNRNHFGNTTPRIPLASWAKYMTDSLSFEELQTETATALRMIADFENIPMPPCTDNIDFKKIYHAIANAMEGKSFPEDKLTSMILDKCIMETALFSKGFIRNSYLKYLIENIDLSEKEINAFSRPTTDNAFVTVQYLASRKNYNPLRIPEDYCKTTKGQT